MKTITAITIFISLILVSCSGKPSASDAEEVLASEISTNSNRNFELNSFEKSNAIDNNFLGQEVYVISYKAQLIVKKHCWTYINKSGMGRYFPDFKTYSSPPEFLPSMGRIAVECDKGTEVDFSGEVTYINTENGWIAQSGASIF